MNKLHILYFQERKFYPAAIAWENAKVKLKFQSYKDQNKVRLKLKEDLYFHSKGYSENELKEIYKRIDKEGLYGLISEYFDGTDWEETYSCWNFIGDDWENSGYDIDAMKAAIEKLEEVFQKEANKIQQQPTYAMNA